MQKRYKVILFVLCYSLGLFAVLSDLAVACSCVLFLLLIFLLLRKIITDRFAVILFLIFAVGFFNCSLRLKDSDLLSTYAPANEVKVTGKVTSLPVSASDDLTKFILDAEKFELNKFEKFDTSSKTMVTLFASKEVYKQIEIGDTLTLTGRLTLPKRATNPSEFCYSTYLKYKNVFSTFYAFESDFNIVSKPEKQPYKFLAGLNRLRNKIIDLHSKNIKSPELELLGGIVFGDDAVNPTPDMKLHFQNSGLTHIVAASGMNVSIIFGMWFFISQILRINFRASIFIGMLSVICYTCMTGFGPPVLRASLMLLLILFGKLIDRKADSMSLLFIVAFIMMLFSPTMITNVGFQLSFAVTFGLMLLSPVFIDKVGNKYLKTALSFVLVPFIAQLFAAPIQMFYFNTFTPYSVLANIAVIPMLTFVSFGGFTGCVLAMIKPIAEFCVTVFDFLLYPFLWAITHIAETFSKLPHSSIVVPSPSPFVIILYYMFLLSIFAAIVNEVYRKKSVIVSAVIFGALVFSFLPKFCGATEVIFFNVDNADSALIKTSDNRAILIDTGKAPYKNFSNAAERVILKYLEDVNIKNLDMLILSHYDSDHAGGAPAIIKNVGIDTICVRTKEPINPLSKKILNLAENKSIPVFVPKQNELIFDTGKERLYAVYASNGDDNETSVINILETPNGSVIFAGDSSVEAQLSTLEKSEAIAIKVAHHGAKNTVSDELLALIKPRYAIISTGFNIYGHPDKETLDTLKNNGVKVFRTDKNGAVKLVLDKDKISVYSYNGRNKKFERTDND